MRSVTPRAPVYVYAAVYSLRRTQTSDTKDRLRHVKRSDLDPMQHELRGLLLELADEHDLKQAEVHRASIRAEIAVSESRIYRFVSGDDPKPTPLIVAAYAAGLGLSLEDVYREAARRYLASTESS